MQLYECVKISFCCCLTRIFDLLSAACGCNETAIQSGWCNVVVYKVESDILVSLLDDINFRG